MSLLKLSDTDRQRTAYEACFLLNLAIRDLKTPDQVFDFSEKQMADMIKELSTENFQHSVSKISGLRHIAFQSAVLNLFRLRETRDHLLVGGLFTDQALRDLGLPPLQEFIGSDQNWKSFEIVRHQIAGHSVARKATRSKPGRIIPASVLGKAVREAGLYDWKAFVQRVRRDVIPGVERVRDELASRYPGAKEFPKLFGMEYDYYSNSDR